MKVLEKNQTKVLETVSLLRKVIISPISFIDNDELVNALKSQSGISKYQCLENNIASCSLNTLKNISEVLLDRGFIALDELRINAKLAIEQSLLDERRSKENKQSAVSLNRKIVELKSQLDVTRRINTQMTVIISELRSRLKELVEHDGPIEERKELHRHYNKKIEAELNHTFNGKL